MKILYFLFISVNALINPLFNRNHLTKNNRKLNIKNIKNNIKNNEKINDYLDLIRAKNILPTMSLNLAGGFIANPNLINLLTNQEFIIFTINTQLILFCSMIINDIFDLDVDKINNSNRPLVKDKIKVKEALILYFLLLGIIQYLSYIYLSPEIQNIINYSLIFINLYTPLLKKIPFIKNISCALIVAAAVYFSGDIFNNNLLLIVATITIFFGSVLCELLLDIKDYEGDKINNIFTLPVLLGKNTAYKIGHIILSLLIFLTILFLDTIFNLYYTPNIVFLIDTINTIILFPLIVNFLNIKKLNYSKKSIDKYMNESNIILFFILLFYSGLAYLIN